MLVDVALSIAVPERDMLLLSILCTGSATGADGLMPHSACHAPPPCLAHVAAAASADTLHRFCKKEHDWGWKKFMELSKVLEGFTVANTLVIKAQVQVIRCVRVRARLDAALWSSTTFCNSVSSFGSIVEGQVVCCNSSEAGSDYHSLGPSALS